MLASGQARHRRAEVGASQRTIVRRTARPFGLYQASWLPWHASSARGHSLTSPRVQDGAAHPSVVGRPDRALGFAQRCTPHWDIYHACRRPGSTVLAEVKPPNNRRHRPSPRYQQGMTVTPLSPAADQQSRAARCCAPVRARDARYLIRDAIRYLAGVSRLFGAPQRMPQAGQHSESNWVPRRFLILPRLPVLRKMVPADPVRHTVRGDCGLLLVITRPRAASFHSDC